MIVLSHLLYDRVPLLNNVHDERPDLGHGVDEVRGYLHAGKLEAVVEEPQHKVPRGEVASLPQLFAVVQE